MTNRTIIQALAAALLAAACAREAPVMLAAPRPDPKLDATGQYPSDITPPAGTQYPCALTALPRDLPGIPPQERDYINHTYARILRATQAKLVAQKALEENRDAVAAVKKYDETAATLIEALQGEVPPSGLEPFRDDVVSAIGLQRTFFQKALPKREAGAAMGDLYAISEAHQASAKLMSAWGAMSSRYPAWSEATKGSIYHHLCALDFF